MFRRILVGYLDEEHGREAMALGQVLARATGAELEAATAPEGKKGLAQMAKAHDSDLMVLGPTHRDVDAGVRVIGVAYDGSPPAKEALATAAQLALSNGAAMRVYAVADAFVPAPVGGGDGHHRGLSSGSRGLRDALHEAVAGLPSEARALPVFLRGDPAEKLIMAAKEGVDLLILGSRGGGPVRRLLHHSVTSRVIQDGALPVLISPAGVASPPGER